MQEINPSYYIEYYTEKDQIHPKYKKAISNNPHDVKYEKDMFFFSIIKTFDINIEGKIKHILINRDNTYFFGEIDTAANIIKRMEKGEYFPEYASIIKHYPANKKLHITPNKDLHYYYSSKHYIPIDTPTNNIEKSKNIDEYDLLNCKKTWYIQYQKHNDNNIYYKRTFCGDKKFRYNAEIEKYKFVRIAEFSINEKDFQVLVESEDQIYFPIYQPLEDEIDEAIDSAKLLISDEIHSNEMFAGYTPVYPFNTEDSSSVFRKQQQYINHQDVITVTGSGDAIIDLFMYGAKSVTCFDINRSAKFYAKLKFTAIKAGLSFEEYTTFFCGKFNGDVIFDHDIYNKFSDILDKDTKKYWDNIFEYLEVSERKLKNDEHGLLYSIISPLGNSNQSLYNESSYLAEENYEKAQKIIQATNDDDLKFIDSPLFDLNEKLENKKFNYMYLSNIMDFTKQFINNPDVKQRLEIFKFFITNNLVSNLSESGCIDVCFLKNNWEKNNQNLSFDEYPKIFKSEENFSIQSLDPYNTSDSILTFKNRVLINNIVSTQK